MNRGRELIELYQWLDEAMCPHCEEVTWTLSEAGTALGINLRWGVTSRAFTVYRTRVEGPAVVCHDMNDMIERGVTTRQQIIDMMLQSRPIEWKPKEPA